MSRLMVNFLVVVAVAFPGIATAQVESEMARIRASVSFAQMKAMYPNLTYNDYEAAVRSVAASRSTYLGRYSVNRYDSESTGNPYSTYGSEYSSTSIRNPYGSYGSGYSSRSARNPYATQAPRLYAEDGTYLGRLSTNRYDPESVSNPYGVYGSRYSPTSIKNPYSVYGSKYSTMSPWNPYSTSAPIIVGDDD